MTQRSLAAALTLGLLAAAPLAAQERSAEEAKLTFTFQRASIQAFLGYLSREAGFSFVEEAAVQGDITAVAEKPLTRSQALDVLRAWLLPKGRTLLRTGDVVRILTLEEAKRRGLPVRVGAEPEQINDNEEMVTQVMPLRYVQAQQVKEQLEGLISDQGSLMIEPTSNSLVVRDTSASIRRFAEVLKALDQAVTSELQVKVYRLENADSEEVTKVVQELFSGEAAASASGGGGRGRGGGRGGMRDMARMFFGGGRGGRGGRGGGGGSGGASVTGGAGVQPVQVTSDARTNSVVVTASPDQLRLIDELIDELDRDPDPVVTQIHTFALQNADATELVSTITALFEDDTQTQAQGQNQNIPRFMRRMMRGQGGGSEDAGSSDRYAPKPKLTVDARTNTLIVSAVPNDLALIIPLVEELDRNPTESSSVWVATLRHANAENLAQILSDALADSGQVAQGGGGGGGGRNNQGNNRNRNRNRNAGNQQAAAGASNAPGLAGLVGEVTVVADAEANALVFTTSPRNVDRLKTIVGQLDQARREVFIECLIAEVQLSDRGELGVQWNAMFTNSLENDEDGTSSVGTDFGLDSLQDGLRYTTTSGNLTGLLRALKTEGRLNILSSPKILVLENAAAEISVGQEVPFVTNSRITQNGDTVNTIQYRDVGIILQVEPQVNDDGYVRLTVHPEVSSIAPDSESVPISEGVRSPTFNRNFADTTIVVGSGETAVIGGMIQDTYSETRFKIPLLGDIPVLGHVFGSTIREKVKQEIVVFLTPHVIENAGQLRDRSRRVVSDYALVPQEMLQAELDRWLRRLEEGTHAFHYNRGTVLFESGRLPEAIEELEKAARLDPADAATFLNLGLAQARAGSYHAAEAAFRSAERLDPGDPEVPYNLGAVLWRRGDYPQAVASFQRALSLDPRHEGARRWLPQALREQQRVERELLQLEEPR